VRLRLWSASKLRIRLDVSVFHQSCTSGFFIPREHKSDDSNFSSGSRLGRMEGSLQMVVLLHALVKEGGVGGSAAYRAWWSLFGLIKWHDLNLGTGTRAEPGYMYRTRAVAGASAHPLVASSFRVDLDKMLSGMLNRNTYIYISL